MLFCHQALNNSHLSACRTIHAEPARFLTASLTYSTLLHSDGKLPASGTVPGGGSYAALSPVNTPYISLSSPMYVENRNYVTKQLTN